ncbi:hypothetical protein VTK26DRAFT_9063 [Humicola hyalothermophila]
MDSVHRPTGPLPFGYGLDQGLHHDFEDSQGPPVPEGSELLDNNEMKYLSNFFEGVTVHNGSYGTSMLFGEGLGGFYTNRWCFPPELVGHEVSYGTAAGGLVESTFPGVAHLSGQESHSLRPTPNMMLPPMPAQQPSSSQQPQHPQHHQQPQHRLGDQHASADVLAAATALSRSSGAQFDMLYSPNQDTPSSVSHSVGPARHRPHYGEPGSGEANQPPSSQATPGQFNSLVFPPLRGDESYRRRARPPVDEVQFGSDPNFNRTTSNFVPQSERETTEAISAEQLLVMSCLERNVSAAPTRAPSPTSWSPQSPSGRRNSLLSPVKLKTMSHNPLTPEELDDDGSGRPKKRRRSTKPGDANMDEDAMRPSASALIGQASVPGSTSLPIRKLSTTPALRRTKPTGPLTPEAEAAAGTGPGSSAGSKKRRKSAAPGGTTAAGAPAKAPRENLTEEQKRENHIRSEQKRRNIIKNGFNDLTAVVPTLAGGGYSKAAMLNMTADWLAQIMEENEKLRKRLAQEGVILPPVSGPRSESGRGSGTQGQGQGVAVGRRGTASVAA